MQAPAPGHPTHPALRLLDGRFYAEDPHPHFSWMRRHAPVYWDPEGRVWGVARYADVVRVSRDPETFCSRHGSRPDSPPLASMINLDDPAHLRRRSLVNRGFTPRRVAAHEPWLRALCGELLDRALARDRFDFVREVAAPLPMRVIGELLGVAPEDHERLLGWSDAMLEATSASAPAEAALAAARAFGEYVEYHRRVVADRRARGAGEDLMSVLVRAEIDGERLDDEALLQESLLILVGGDETTRHVISGGMHQLLLHPEQLHGLMADPARIPRAVEEMLRWSTPIQNMARTATRDVELGGQRIRSGDRLLLLYPSANRDETIFERPFEFDVAREPNDHLAFGHGSHFCLGASLARLELRVLFEELAARRPHLTLAAEAPLRWRASNFITGLESLPVEAGRS